MAWKLRPRPHHKGLALSRVSVAGRPAGGEATQARRAALRRRATALILHYNRHRETMAHTPLVIFCCTLFWGIRASSPLPRSGTSPIQVADFSLVSSTLGTSSDVLLMFGGKDLLMSNSNNAANLLFQFNVSSGVWSKIFSRSLLTPAARHQHSAVALTAGGTPYMCMYGGRFPWCDM